SGTVELFLRQLRLSSLHLLNLFADFGFNFVREFWIVVQQLANRITALAKFIGVIAIPASTLAQDTEFYTHIYNLTGFGNSFSENDIKLGCTKRRSYFVFNHFHFYAVTHCFIAIFNLRNTANIESNG